jgi:hypothetical protein
VQQVGHHHERQLGVLVALGKTAPRETKANQREKQKEQEVEEEEEEEDEGEE